MNTGQITVVLGEITGYFRCFSVWHSLFSSLFCSDGYFCLDLLWCHLGNCRLLVSLLGCYGYLAVLFRDMHGCLGRSRMITTFLLFFPTSCPLSFCSDGRCTSTDSGLVNTWLCTRYISLTLDGVSTWSFMQP